MNRHLIDKLADGGELTRQELARIDYRRQPRNRRLSGRTGKCSQRTDLRPPGIHPRLDRIYKLLQK